MSAFTLLVGDALERLRELPDDSVQTCVTSPPYWGLRDYGVEGQIGLESTPDEYVARLVRVFEEVRRVLKPDGTLWLNLGDSYANDGKWGGSTGGKHAGGLHGNTNAGRGKKTTGLPPKNLIGIPWRVAFALQAAGWTLRQDIVWHKPNPMPAPVTDRCVSAHEYLFLLSKSERYHFDHVAIREPATGRSSGNGFDRAERVSLGGRGDPTPFEGVELRNKRSVWTVGTSPYRGAHFATFPPQLIEPCVLAGSRPGDIVLDPFAGTGTTGIVALKEGRRFVGVELNPAYAEMAEQRSRSITPSLFLTKGAV